VNAIARANNISNINVIYVGQVLTIPADGAPPTPIPVPPTPIPPPTQTCPILRRGDRGAFVRRLQTLLLNRGIDPGPIDGIFGFKTEIAVRTFQAQAGLTVQTWTALGVNCTQPPGPPIPIPPTPTPPEACYFCPVLRLGRVGPAVRFLQRALQERGFYRGPIDGDFGGRTQQAVRQFQRQQGLTVTGVVNRATWEALGYDCCDEPSPPAGTPIQTKVGRGIRHILYTNKAVYNRGEDVDISLSKTNITDDEISLRYSTSQIIEITIRNAAGRIVWKYSQNRQFAQFSRLITIFEGGTQVIKEVWKQVNNAGNQVASGTYTITVENLATNVSLSVQIQIR
jgi:peptidoglycan hydrolase-like protein with peptidoglycan-binding domain